MSSLRFLVDLTTSRAYKGVNPVGIVRTEREIGKALLASNHEVEFFFFNPDTKEFLLISRHEATIILGETKDNETGFRSQCFDLKTSEVTPDVAEDGDLRSFLGRVSRCIVQRRALNTLDGTSVPVVAYQRWAIMGRRLPKTNLHNQAEDKTISSTDNLRHCTGFDP
mgnify:CR=1 FL=1